ncbi:hypothetical protein ALI144C_42055 [Actinosynnema sp. ALI-1.44]|uniref:PASTA domain-containing protein n=1 Tax=Actinosynnema sp. ALI-1.44 TaxID=1933779 RepID=UPI00097BD307|nr:PASTA domain-containing protein [Actinosynnema sp. ALI-1.44]ONI72613.1 hypothetical protein ALI144C_42055 [Actinosynnema sp. ALI-1.44]
MTTESKTAAWALSLIATAAIFLTFFFDDSNPESTVPGDLTGKSAVTADNQLRRLGFANIMYLSELGGSATVRPDWTVVSVDGAGQTVGLDTWITIRVR